MAEFGHRRIVETATEARGAVPGPQVRNVLLISTASVIVLFALVGWYFFG
ncbi:MAG: hypothetical protein WDN48_05055 [Pseudolabrys sp.]